MMDAGELLLKAHELGAPFITDGALVIPADLPPTMKADAVRLRAILAPLLSLTVAQLCGGMTDDEREAFDERAAILEADAGYPRELAERVAVWWVRTPSDERERRAA
jgi:hypothetical protein